MEHWHSGLIPYPTLLAVQIVMLILMLKICTDIWRRDGAFARRRPARSRLLTRLSALYAAAMVLRYVLTMSFRPERRWLGGTLPIFFTSSSLALLLFWAIIMAPQISLQITANDYHRAED